jgi:Ca2+-binding EF-hand superfamily protein
MMLLVPPAAQSRVFCSLLSETWDLTSILLVEFSSFRSVLGAPSPLLQCLSPTIPFFSTSHFSGLRLHQFVSGKLKFKKQGFCVQLCFPLTGKGTQEEKIVYAFKGYDLQNTGLLSRSELRSMFKAYFHLSMELVRDLVKALEQEMMANFNDEGDKPVSAVFTAPIPNIGGVAAASKPDDLDMSDLNISGIPGQYRLAVSHAHSELGPSLAALSDEAIEELVQKAFESADLDGDDWLSFEEFKRWAIADGTMIQWFDSLGSVF